MQVLTPKEKERRQCAPGDGGEAPFHPLHLQQTVSPPSSGQSALPFRRLSVCRGAETSATAWMHSLWWHAPPNYLRGRLGIATGATSHKLAGKVFTEPGRSQPTRGGGEPPVSFHHCWNILQQIREHLDRQMSQHLRPPPPSPAGLSRQPASATTEAKFIKTTMITSTETRVLHPHTSAEAHHRVRRCSGCTA